MKKNAISKVAVAGLFGVAAILGAMPGCSAKSVSGTFTGTAKGNGGDVTVTLTIEKNVITDVKADGPKETVGIGDKALEKLPTEMVAGNTITVDTVSGATITSNAVLEAAKAALEKSGLKASDLAKVTASAAAAEDVTETADVVIVGAGGAGMTAAIVATDAGKKVIVVESQDVSGGNSVRSTGGMNAAKTTYQDSNTFGESAGVEKTLKSAEKYADNADVKALTETVTKQWADYQANPTGYFDSVELMELDTMVGGYAKNDFSLVKTLAENSSAAVDWLASIGAKLTSVGQFGGASVKRIHRPVDDEGKVISVGSYVVPILEKNLTERNVEIMYNTTANKILMDDGKAVGIEASGKDGNKVTINAKSVVMATGGFGANNDMVVAQNHPELKGYITTNAAGAQGQGITMATADDVSAATVDMDQIQLHPTVHVDADNNASLITEGLRGDGAILVNAEGKRFTDEVGTRDVVSAAENAQTGSSAWLIVDQSMVDASAVIQGYIKKGFTVTGTDAASLAKEMNVDADALSTTIETWNKAVEAKSDPDFNRTSFNHQLTGNLYALTVQPGIHHTMGGLKINTNTEVLSTDGTVIGGLFAAGEVTGGVHGANRLGGNAVADFTVFGRIAGTAAAAYAK
jgi:fumarate reductase flavoprotein subunit